MILPLILMSGLRVTTSQLGAYMSACSLAVAAFSAVGMIPAMRCVGNESDRLACAGIGCRLVSLILFGMTCSLVIMADRPESTSDVVDVAMAPSNFGLYATTLVSVAVSLSSQRPHSRRSSPARSRRTSAGRYLASSTAFPPSPGSSDRRWKRRYYLGVRRRAPRGFGR
ncbi:hypothetical protein ACHAXA_000310 [Cyclostephanos tholiformis]|uniref:Uncharacterized protein n=1 Tax=Cyclostephanos tholiformis TaxID=382380 RepID=A0ABD3RRS5_9STRA